MTDVFSGVGTGKLHLLRSYTPPRVMEATVGNVEAKESDKSRIRT